MCVSGVHGTGKTSGNNRNLKIALLHAEKSLDYSASEIGYMYLRFRGRPVGGSTGSCNFVIRSPGPPTARRKTCINPLQTIRICRNGDYRDPVLTSISCLFKKKTVNKEQKAAERDVTYSSAASSLFGSSQHVKNDSFHLISSSSKKVQRKRLMSSVIILHEADSC